MTITMAVVAIIYTLHLFNNKVLKNYNANAVGWNLAAAVRRQSDGAGNLLDYFTDQII